MPFFGYPPTVKWRYILIHWPNVYITIHIWTQKTVIYSFNYHFWKNNWIWAQQIGPKYEDMVFIDWYTFWKILTLMSPCITLCHLLSPCVILCHLFLANCPVARSRHWSSVAVLLRQLSVRGERQRSRRNRISGLEILSPNCSDLRPSRPHTFRKEV